MNERDAQQAAHPVYHVGQSIPFSGYADDFDQGIAAIQFSLDDGATWTTYETEGTVTDKGVNWRFNYTPTRPGRYLLKARVLDKQGSASALVSRFAFEVLP